MCPRINERAMNACIAQAMRKMCPPQYDVRPEQHGAHGQGNLVPDIVVRMEPYNLRTIIETEYGEPAVADARNKLGFQFSDSTIPMKSILAVGIPEELGELDMASLEEALQSDEPQFKLQVVTGKSPDDPDVSFTPPPPPTVQWRRPRPGLSLRPRSLRLDGRRAGEARR